MSIAKDVAKAALPALLDFVVDAVTNKGVSPARVRQLIEDEMTDQANADMRRELER